MSTRGILDSDDEENNQQELRVNAKYAQSFEEKKRKEDLTRAKDLFIDDDDDDDEESSEESEDEIAEQLSSNLELQILTTINSIRRRDPKVYDKNLKWFEEQNDDSDQDSQEDDHPNNRSNQAKKMRYKDVLREQLLEGGDGDDLADTKNDLATTQSSKRLVYDKEQEKIRKQFLQEAKSVLDDNAGMKEEEDHGFLSVKVKSAADRERDNQIIERALQEMKSLGTQTSSKPVHSLSSGEEAVDVDVDNFLSDYIAKQKWREKPSSASQQRIEEYDDSGVVEDEVDEKELEAAEEFESRYNFRFEELQGKDGNSSHALNDLQVTGHARQVAGSLRRVDDKRKIQRELQRERKEREKRQKEAEMRRLKNLKRQEVSRIILLDTGLLNNYIIL
jgi:protein KRI1